MSDGVETVYLGQFEHDNAEAIAAALEEAGIVWWHKAHGRLAGMLFAGDWGVRMFVERDRETEARDIAAGIAPAGLA